VKNRKEQMADFDKALGYVLENEGGYSADKHDHGGETMFGISTPTLTEYQTRFRDLIGKRAHDLTLPEAAKVYHQMFWRFDRVENQRIATKLFDVVVNLGTVNGTKLIQRAVNQSGIATRVQVDGLWGKNTLNAVNYVDPDILMEEIRDRLHAFYSGIVDRDHTQAVFLRGWLRRADRMPKR
jgi:lysozyme family protein